VHASLDVVGRLGGEWKTHGLGFGSILMGMGLCSGAGLPLPLQTHLHVGRLEAPYLPHCRMPGICRVLHQIESVSIFASETYVRWRWYRRWGGLAIITSVDLQKTSKPFRPPPPPPSEAKPWSAF